VTFVAGLLFGDLAQPDAFSPANDNISDIGAQTAPEIALSILAEAVAVTSGRPGARSRQ
jgi:hypothetical protein